MRLVLPGGARPREIGRVGTVRTVVYRPLAGVEISSRTGVTPMRHQLLSWVMKHLGTINIVISILVGLGALIGMILGWFGLSRK
jgi:hypothetical protein